MDEKEKIAIAREGVKGLMALKQWYVDGTEPKPINLKALIALRWLSFEGLTAEGVLFLYNLSDAEAPANRKLSKAERIEKFKAVVEQKLRNTCHTCLGDKLVFVEGRGMQWCPGCVAKKEEAGPQ
jgi:hypothetical protein